MCKAVCYLTCKPFKVNNPTCLEKYHGTMPEGHTVHRLALDHTKWLAGKRLGVSSPQGRFEVGAQLLSGKSLNTVEAHGKHLYYTFSSKLVLHVHLGLYGKFRLYESPPPEPRGAVRIRFVGKTHTLDLNGPNQCEILSSKQVRDSRSKLGEDPLRSDADPERVWARMQRSKQPVGQLLLDQSVVAGIGNIYRAEILFLLKIHPSRPSCSLTRNEFDDLWKTSLRLLAVGVKYNRIITVDRDETDKPLSQLSSDERLLIYKKERCPTCQSTTETWLLGNRQMFACSVCQV